MKNDQGAFWNRWYNLLKNNKKYLTGRWSSHPSISVKEHKYDNEEKPSQYEINIGEIDGYVFCILFGKYASIKKKEEDIKIRKKISKKMRHIMPVNIHLEQQINLDVTNH